MPSTIYKAKDASFTLRLPARFKFGFELLAKQNQVTQSHLFMEAVGKVIEKELVTSEGKSLLGAVWSPFPAERLVNLGLHAPRLLDDLEMAIWTVIKETSKYWKKDQPDFKAIRDNWESIRSEAKELLEKQGG